VQDRTDEQAIVKRLRESDVEAFGLLFKRYQPVLFRHVAYLLRDSDAAHDIVQETFVRVWERRATLKPGLSIVAYLYTISTNLVRDKQRHEGTRAKSRELIPPPIPPPDQDPLETAQHALLSDHVRRVVSEDLPERCRMVFELSRIEGLNNREIAEKLQISEKTVENQLTKGLRILQRKIRAFRTP